MPHYFFHIYDDLITHDEEGMQLTGVDEARERAVNGARDLIADQVKKGYLVQSHWIDVCDESGEKVLTVRFGDAVEIKD